MKTPESLESLVDDGIIEDVVRPLMSGKEAQVYVVIAGGEECVAKVYKEASQRTFKHRAEYTEGRRTRNSRDQRAVSKRTRHGRKQDEAAWRTTEVDMIYRLRDAGVRVPEPINFVDGVLVMELVKDGQGNPAPRLGDLTFEAREADEIYQGLIQEVVRMLCAGVVHGDLSDFNVLMGASGPVLIDFPQAVDPARNPNARKLLLRDVDNLHRFVESHAPNRARRGYSLEMCSLYESNRLGPDTQLRGDYRAPEGKANTEDVLALIDDANSEERARRRARGEEASPDAVAAPKPLREVVDFTKEAKPRASTPKRASAGRGARPEHPRKRLKHEPVSTESSAADVAATPKKVRSRRRRKSGIKASASTSAVSATSETAAKHTTTAASEASSPKRRRRKRRPQARSKPDEASAGARSHAKRTSKPATGRPGASESTGTDRPRRRRRRRPSATRSRETT